MFRLARTPPRWLRVALAGLLLAFALNSIAHVTHSHDPRIAHSLHSVACGYCATFDNIAGAPSTRALSLAPPPLADFVALPATTVSSRFVRTSAQPRAPPVS